MPTATDELVKQLKRSSRSTGIIVPRIEKFMQRPVEIEDDADRKFINDLVEARSEPRKQGVYSPSVLAECVRKVYFLKTKEVKAKPAFRVETNAIFLDGNWRHFKWQFLMWKMHRAGLIELVDVGSVCLGTEIYVENERGDFGGTIDNLIYIPEIDLLSTIDWKGMGGNPFMKSVVDGPAPNYVVQTVGYAGLANFFLEKFLPKKIQSSFILGENKNGLIRNSRVNSPLGLYEWELGLDDYRHLVSRRLKTLRAHERRKEIPPAECVSTKRVMFKDCPFSAFCRGEVERNERKLQREQKKQKAKKKKVSFNKERRNGRSSKS